MKEQIKLISLLTALSMIALIAASAFSITAFATTDENGFVCILIKTAA